MEAKELRIGNYFLYGKEKRQDEVYQIKFDRQDGYMINGIIPIDFVYPIPLNEEWLRKFGFASDINKEWWFNGTINLGYITTDSNLEFEFAVHKLPAQVKYVHTLQNLIFALTGEELKEVNPA